MRITEYALEPGDAWRSREGGGMGRGTGGMGKYDTLALVTN